MAKTISAKQVRDLRVQAVATMLLIRRFAPHLVKAFFERLAVEDRVRRHLTPRKRRSSRTLKIGVSAVGVVAAGVAAARLAGQHGPFGDDRPEIDRA
jgi:hypothetical protein